jgi:hypothetical protein
VNLSYFGCIDIEVELFKIDESTAICCVDNFLLFQAITLEYAVLFLLGQKGWQSYLNVQAKI